MKESNEKHKINYAKDMMNFQSTTLFSILIFSLAFFSCGENRKAQQSASASFVFDTLPDLAAFQGDAIQHGLGGTFSGTHNGAIIVAGGTHFDGEYFWEGATKRWFDHIMVFHPTKKEWVQQSISLAEKLSYGVSVSTNDGLYIIGGRDASHISNKVYRLQWNVELEQIIMDSMPDLPTPLCFMSGALVGNAIYVAGGMDSMEGELKKHCYKLSLDGDVQNQTWQQIPPWPGAPRLLPSVVGQSDGATSCLYLFGGQFPRKGTTNEYLFDAYQYNPTTSQWRQVADIQSAKGLRQSLFAAPGVAIGANHIALFGGVDGRINIQLEQINLHLNATTDSTQIAVLKTKQKEILSTHPGFFRKVLLYHTITDTWTVGGEMPYAPLITNNAFTMGDQVIIPNGESSPGVRSKQVYSIGLLRQKGQMNLFDYLLLAIYAVVLIIMGWYFARRQKTTEDYFKGGGRIPWWAAAMSLLGTVLSAITFMAVPAKTFATNWAYLVLSLSIILIPPIVSRVFIPTYKKYNITSAFEYLQLRFNKWVQLVGAISFLIFQLGRVGIILYLPALALNVVLGVDLFTCIVLVGLVSVVYTLLGGIEAVIWTDVFQVVILIGGALVCLFLITIRVDGGMTTIMDIAISKDKFEIFNMAFDLKQPTFWVVLLGGFFSYLITFGTDQTMVQRYLTTTNVADAQKSIWMNALVALPVIVLFFFIGTALFGFYQQYPHALPAGIAADGIFPAFIVRELPVGMPGLMIAAIFAAAMSSISSSINSAATVYAIDCHPFFSVKKTGLSQARVISLLFGVAGTGFAMLLASSDIKSIWDEFIKIIGLLTGGLGGIFLLGMLTKRANGKGALLGLLCSAMLQYLISNAGLVHVLLYTVTGFLGAFVMGYGFSLFWKETEE